MPKNSGMVNRRDAIVRWEFIPVAITPGKQSANAKPLHYWALDDFLAWAAMAEASVRELRATFSSRAT